MEMMAVVIIAGVLATLATYGVRKYVFSSKTTEAIHMIGSIKSAEEAYRAETYTYIGVAKAGLLASSGHLYPQVQPGRIKTEWNNQNHADYASVWGPLGAVSDSPVIFGYVVATGTGALPADSDLGSECSGISFGTRGSSNTGTWYVVKAVADQNGDTHFSCFISCNLTGEIFSENDDE